MSVVNAVILQVSGLDPAGRKIAQLASNGFSEAVIRQTPNSDRGLIEMELAEPVTDEVLRALVADAEQAAVTVDSAEARRPTFDELLDRHLADLESYVAAVEAERFRDYLADHYPDVLKAWHQEREVIWISQAIGLRDRSERGKARRRARARQFHEASESFERDGDYEALNPFTVRYVVNDDNARKQVGDMTGVDHRFVASQYERSAKQDQMLAAFHHAVAKKIGRKRTRDVLTPEQYEALYRSIVGGDAT